MTARQSGSLTRLAALGCLCILVLVPSVASGQPSQTEAVGRPTLLEPGVPAHTATHVGALPATTIAEVEWSTSNNATVYSNMNATLSGQCINSGESPCFTLELTVEDYDTLNSSYVPAQWAFFVQRGNDIVGCATGDSLTCGSSNECTYTGDTSDGFEDDTFEILFTSATVYELVVDNSVNGYTECSSLATGSISGVVSWEVSTGVGLAGYCNASYPKDCYGACADWTGLQTWDVSGYAPSSITTALTPKYCTPATGHSSYNWGSVGWGTSGYSSLLTLEASNLQYLSGTYSNADNFSYLIYN